MIKINKLNFSYGRHEVFNNISLTFKEGQIYGLLGQNGVGKTTLLKILTGLQKVDKGECIIDGIRPYSRDPNFLNNVYFLQEEPPTPDLKIEEYAKNLGLFYPNFDFGKLYQLLKDFEVSPKSKFSKLSLGQKKKGILSIALSLNTKYLFMDEPSNGLDIPSKAQLRKAIAQNCTDESIIIISTHQVKDLENLIDPIIILDKDEVLLNASIEEISNKLYFNYDGEKDASCLYMEQTLGGYLKVSENVNGVESKVNIEALFNTVHQNKEHIKELFRK